MPEGDNTYEDPEQLLAGSDRPRPLPAHLRARLEEALEGLAEEGTVTTARPLPGEVRDKLAVSLRSEDRGGCPRAGGARKEVEDVGAQVERGRRCHHRAGHLRPHPRPRPWLWPCRFAYRCRGPVHSLRLGYKRPAPPQCRRHPGPRRSGRQHLHRPTGHRPTGQRPGAYRSPGAYGRTDAFGTGEIEPRRAASGVPSLCACS